MVKRTTAHTAHSHTKWSTRRFFRHNTTEKTWHQGEIVILYKFRVHLPLPLPLLTGEADLAWGVLLLPTLLQVATAHACTMYMVHIPFMAPSRSVSDLQLQWRPGRAGRCQKLTYAKGKVSITSPRCSNGKNNIQGRPGGCKLDPYSVWALIFF